MSLRNQTIINTAGNTVYFVSLWFLTVVTTRVLGSVAVGTLTLAMALGNVVGMLQMFGMRAFQSSDISFQFTARDYCVTRIITVATGWGMALAVCFLLGYEKQVSLSIILFVLLKSSETFSDVLFGNDQRLGHLEYGGYSMIARGLLLTGLFTVGTFIWRDLNAALLAAAIGVLALTLMVDLPIHNILTKNSGGSTERAVFEILKACSPILISTMLPSVITAFPRVLLERYYGAEVLGFYGNVSTPALLLTTVTPTILIAFLPNYGSAAIAKDYRRLRGMWLKSVGYTAVITGLCMIGILLFGKQVLSSVYTNQIKAYAHYLYPILLAMMLYTFTMCNNTVLVALRKNWGLALTTILALSLNLLLSIPLVRTWGVNGAIAALAIPYVVQTIVQAVWIISICKKENHT